MSTTQPENKEGRELASSMLAEITRSEQHFNTLETEYRKLTSSWLLATFAAMGYVATAKDLPVPAGTTIFLIGVAASVGIQLLWIVDLMTYHQLLLANFLEGLRVEQQHPELPQVRGNMVAQGSTGKRVRLFYLGSALAPLAFGVAAFFNITHPQDSVHYDVMIGAVTIGLVTSCVVWMIKSPGRWVRVQVAALNAGNAQPASKKASTAGSVTVDKGYDPVVVTVDLAGTRPVDSGGIASGATPEAIEA